MSEVLIKKEKEVELSRLKYSLLEYELRILKKEEEITRLKKDLEKVKTTLKQKEKENE